MAQRASAGTVASHRVDQHEACPRARSAQRAHLLLPRGVLVDVLRDFAGQRTSTGATLPPCSSTLALLCQGIEHEALGIGMIVKGLKLRASLNLHHAHIPYALTAVGADQLFSLHAAHLLSPPSAAMTCGPCTSPIPAIPTDCSRFCARGLCRHTARSRAIQVCTTLLSTR